MLSFFDSEMFFSKGLVWIVFFFSVLFLLDSEKWVSGFSFLVFWDFVEEVFLVGDEMMMFLGCMMFFFFVFLVGLLGVVRVFW